MISQQDRDRILDMLGRLDGYTEPNYAKVEKITGVKAGTLRQWVYRDRQRNGVTDMTDIRQGSDDLRVDAHQVRAIDVLVREGESATESAALAAGVTSRTVRQWKHDPGFRAKLREDQATYRATMLEGMREHALMVLEKLEGKLDEMSARELLTYLPILTDRTGLPRTERVEQATVQLDLTAHSSADLARLLEE
jgi:hypothetical protein